MISKKAPRAYPFLSKDCLILSARAFIAVSVPLPV
jgi:hypothetical protein